MAEKLKVGIIGLGVGSRHIACFDSHPNCEVTVLCDNNESKLRQAKEKFPGKNIAKDANLVLSMAELDVVSIATYDDAHYEQIITGIENGKHLFVEKPFVYRKSRLNALEISWKKAEAAGFIKPCITRIFSFSTSKERYSIGKYGELYYLEGYQYGRHEN